MSCRAILYVDHTTSIKQTSISLPKTCRLQWNPPFYIFFLPPTPYSLLPTPFSFSPFLPFSIFLSFFSQGNNTYYFALPLYQRSASVMRYRQMIYMALTFLSDRPWFYFFQGGFLKLNQYLLSLHPARFWPSWLLTWYWFETGHNWGLSQLSRESHFSLWLRQFMEEPMMSGDLWT